MGTLANKQQRKRDRQMIAARIMAAIVAKHGVWTTDTEEYAERAVKMTDALLNRLNQ